MSERLVRIGGHNDTMIFQEIVFLFGLDWIISRQGHDGLPAE